MMFIQMLLLSIYTILCHWGIYTATHSIQIT